MQHSGSREQINWKQRSCHVFANQLMAKEGSFVVLKLTQKCASMRGLNLNVPAKLIVGQPSKLELTGFMCSENRQIESAEATFSGASEGDYGTGENIPEPLQVLPDIISELMRLADKLFDQRPDLFAVCNQPSMDMFAGNRQSTISNRWKLGQI
ncbi:hypothetical protein HELRODRAFT_182308 [Helobdella robusta]|uniref:Uncharacterized protein n=1 Tax=Helobdella robusta TaxID=6412 RepID=T1FI13_HELRO|nr:hypothetical protein HELRODRAFT_182308 [Helobdella robusta]ESN91058.1 hypothetical protein HELRODRAFT_182308 [Helobdella robusta]